MEIIVSNFELLSAMDLENVGFETGYTFGCDGGLIGIRFFNLGLLLFPLSALSHSILGLMRKANYRMQFYCLENSKCLSFNKTVI